jgi:hypothetical protein
MHRPYCTTQLSSIAYCRELVVYFCDHGTVSCNSVLLPSIKIENGTVLLALEKIQIKFLKSWFYALLSYHHKVAKP